MEWPSKNLLAIHCLTGSDTTSALYKIGKKTAFDTLQKNIGALSQLEQIPMLSEDDTIKVSSKYIFCCIKIRIEALKT